MTKRDELIALADGLSFAAQNTEGCLYSQRKMLNDASAALRLSALEAPAAGDGEPVAWPANLHPRTLDLVQRFAVALAKKLRLAEEKYERSDGWLRDDWESECRDHLYQHLEKGDPRDVAAYCAFMWHHDWITCRPVITAPPADAGMREALGKVCIYRVEGDDTIHLLIDGEKIGAFGQHTSKAIALLRFEASLREACMEAALTAPGATTKSDGGAKAGSSPTLADKGEQRTRAHGVMPVGDNADASGCTGVGPSDPSPTRSDVTVEELARSITPNPDECVCGSGSVGSGPDGKPQSSFECSMRAWERNVPLATALLDQFEIRRK